MARPLFHFSLWWQQKPTQIKAEKAIWPCETGMGMRYVDSYITPNHEQVVIDNELDTCIYDFRILMLWELRIAVI